MNARAKLTAFGVAIVVTFGLGLGIGSAVGPLADDEPRPVQHDMGSHPR